MLTRRQLLGGAAAGLALALTRRAHAIGPGSKFRIGHLQLGPGQSWNPRPSALKKLGWEIEKRTSIDVDDPLRPSALKKLGWEIEKRTSIDVDDPLIVTPTSDTLHETPFLYLTGEKAIEVPSNAGVEALRRFCTFGGFLLIDSAEGSTDGAYAGSVRKLISAIFPPPAKGLEIIPADHVVYKSFYLLDKPVGRLAIAPAMEGVIRDGRLVCAYIPNDLGGAWARDDFGNYDFPCEPGGEKQRELSFRLGVNLVMYALCLDYKSDQVHVPFIMKRRRWKPDDGASSPTK